MDASHTGSQAMGITQRPFGQNMAARCEAPWRLRTSNCAFSDLIVGRLIDGLAPSGFSGQKLLLSRALALECSLLCVSGGGLWQKLLRWTLARILRGSGRG
jgi:hypothetical protein